MAESISWRIRGSADPAKNYHQNRPTAARTVMNTSMTASCDGGNNYQGEYGKLPEQAE